MKIQNFTCKPDTLEPEEIDGAKSKEKVKHRNTLGKEGGRVRSRRWRRREIILSQITSVFPAFSGLGERERKRERERERESNGLVKSLAFHQFYFTTPPQKSPLPPSIKKLSSGL